MFSLELYWFVLNGLILHFKRVHLRRPSWIEGLVADISRAEVTRKTYLQTDREKAIITLHAHAAALAN